MTTYIRELLGRKIPAPTISLQTITSIPLLFIILISSITGLGQVIHGLNDETTLLGAFSLIGLVLGWRLGSRRAGWKRYLIWGLVGLPLIFLSTGQLWLSGVEALRSGVFYISKYFGVWITHLQEEIPANIIPSFDPLSLSWSQFSITASNHWDEITGWFENLLIGKPSFKSEAVIFIWVVVFWVLSIFSAWAYRVHNKVFLSVLPSGILLTGGMALIRSKDIDSIFVFFATLLVLMALQNLFNNEERWQRLDLEGFDDFRSDFGFAALAMVTVLVLLIVFTPFVDISNPKSGIASSSDVVRTGELPDIKDSLGVRPPPVPSSAFKEFEYSGLPREHLINLAPNNADVVVMTVEIQDTAPQESQVYYWRSLTYDVYNGSGWGTSELVDKTYRSGKKIYELNIDNARIVRQKITEVEPMGPLAFAAGEIYTIDKPFKVAWHKPLDIERDVFAIIVQSDEYTVESILPFYGIDRLRESNLEYPDWVKDRYLDLPDSTPQRVIQLAEELTAFAPTAYDKAKAIESYLRSYEYTLDVPPAPPELDLVDYFLFDLKRGYCDYYATSMVVMARIVGIPARLAVGFNSGTYDAANDRYFVAAINAHSWVEIYFPNIGWVPFEPTAGIAPIERPIDTPDFVLKLLLPAWEQIADSVVSISITVLALGLAIGILWWSTESNRMKKLPSEIYFQKIYRKIIKNGQRLDVSVSHAATPFEFYNRLSARIKEFGTPASRYSIFISNTIEKLDQLTHLYIQSQYAEVPPSEATRIGAFMLGRQLQIRLIAIVLWNKIQKLRDFFGKNPSAKIH